MAMKDIPVLHLKPDASVRDEIIGRGFTRRPLPFDVAICASLATLAAAAWDVPRDVYYRTGDRFRSLNRFHADILEDGVRIERRDDGAPYLQRADYNPELGGTQREYQPLPAAVADHEGIKRLMAWHLINLPWSRPGASYTVNMHVLRFAASPGRPADTSPPGLHKDGEKYLATHLLARCGVVGGEVVITDNHRQELDRFTMRESGECYVFDDDRIWHMLTPVATAPNSDFGYRDTLAFDMLPDDWVPAPLT
jgi:hypothetical protein